MSDCTSILQWTATATIAVGALVVGFTGLAGWFQFRSLNNEVKQKKTELDTLRTDAENEINELKDNNRKAALKLEREMRVRFAFSSLDSEAAASESYDDIRRLCINPVPEDADILNYISENLPKEHDLHEPVDRGIARIKELRSTR